MRLIVAFALLLGSARSARSESVLILNRVVSPNIEMEGHSLRLDVEPGGRVAHGGMGQVLRVVDIKTGELFALKLVKTQYTQPATDSLGYKHAPYSQKILRANETVEKLEDGSLPSRFFNRVTQTGMAQLYDVKAAQKFSTPAVLLEWLPSPRLKEMQQYFRPDGSQDGARLLRAEKLIRQLVKAEAHLASHGLAHSDIKPSNIFFSVDPGAAFDIAKFDSGESHVVLTDFDLVGPVGDSTRLGTPAFEPPETKYLVHTTGKMPASSLRDLYAIGMTLRRMMGEDFSMQWVKAHRHELSPEALASAQFVAKFVEAATEKLPGKRASKLNRVLRGQYHFTPIAHEFRVGRQHQSVGNVCLIGLGKIFDAVKHWKIQRSTAAN